MANASNFVTRAEGEMRAIKQMQLEIRERARKLLTEYTRLGSNGFTNKHFFVDGVVNGTERTDLNYTKDEFSTAIGNLAALAGMEWEGTKYIESATNTSILTNSVFETIIKVTG